MNPRNTRPEVYDQDDTPIISTGKARRLGIGTYGEVIDLDTGKEVPEGEAEQE